MLEVEREAFLGPIDPDEMRRLPVHPRIVGAREISHAGALDLDHSGAEIGQLACAKRRRDGMFQRNDGDAFERAHQKLLGIPSTCSAT
jgi:hypothetical protein